MAIVLSLDNDTRLRLPDGSDLLFKYKKDCEHTYVVVEDLEVLDHLDSLPTYEVKWELGEKPTKEPKQEAKKAVKPKKETPKKEAPKKKTASKKKK
jgi:hypothetical protein